MYYIQNFFSSILQQIPSVLYAIVLLIVALVAANLVQKLVTKLLKAVKAEEYLSKLGIRADQGKTADADGYWRGDGKEI